MKISILGAGALGCVYGSYLSKEHDVTFFVRRHEHKNSINTKGIRIRNQDKEELFRIPAILSDDVLSIQDIVIVLVKVYDTDRALCEIKHCIGPKTIVVSLQNGLGNYEIISKYVEKENIVLGTSGQGAFVLEDGYVNYSGAGVDNIGALCNDKKSAKLIADIMVQSGFKAEFNEDIEKCIWDKLLVNIGSNAVTAILEQTNTIFVNNENAKTVSRLAIGEAVAVAKTIGIRVDEKSAYERFDSVISKVLPNRTSMLQDIEKNRRTEIDSINGAIVALGEKYGVKTPYNELLCELVKAKERI